MAKKGKSSVVRPTDLKKITACLHKNQRTRKLRGSGLMDWLRGIVGDVGDLMRGHRQTPGTPDKPVPPPVKVAPINIGPRPGFVSEAERNRRKWEGWEEKWKKGRAETKQYWERSNARFPGFE